MHLGLSCIISINTQYPVTVKYQPCNTVCTYTNEIQFDSFKLVKSNISRVITTTKKGAS